MLDLDKVKNFTADKRRSRFLCLLYSHLVVLILLAVLRVVFHFLFNEDAVSIQETLSFYVYGYIFDLRATLLILIPTTIITFIPITFISTNVFSKIMIAFQVVFLMVYFVIAAFDFAHYDLTKLRVGDNLSEVLSGSNITLAYLWQNYPIILVSGLVVMTTVLIIIILELIKRRYLYKGQYGLVFFPYRFERMIWIVVVVPLVYLQISKVPVMNKDLLKSDKEFLNQLGMNPVNNILEKLLH